MDVLLKSALIVDPNSKMNGQQKDILISNGKIKAIKSSIPAGNARVIKSDNLTVSPGWFDMCANFCDPGYEFKEDINSGLAAAAQGGFTGVMISPDVQPPIDSKSHVEYVLTKGQKHLTEIHVQGAISEGLKGEQLAEMHDMHDCGAKAFGDYKHDLASTELMNRALEYGKIFGAPIVTFPFDNGLEPDGVMHEGAVSISLGLKGMPSASEEIRLQRDIEILRYTKGKMHVLAISTANSVDIIRRAKKEKLQITCGMAAHQLSHDESDLELFDTRLKVSPPFRSKKDRLALIKGLKDGTIDVVFSDHTPQDIENKKREFEYAAFGISSIETVAPTIFTECENRVSLDRLVDALAISPRRITGLKIPSIAVDNDANVTIFDPQKPQQFNKETMKSKSRNTPFGGRQFIGTVLGVVRGKKVQING